jgi:glucokinase
MRSAAYNGLVPKGALSLASTVSPCVLVYDVGGSHISCAVCFANDYRLGPIAKANLPETQTSDAFVGVLHSLGKQADDENGPIGAELAMPGPFDYVQGISLMRHKLPYLYGVNLSNALAERFGWTSEQVRFLNDAASYLLGEVGAGAAHGVPRAVGITLGTGVGSAFAVDGRIVTKSKGVPPGGEIWNVPYEGGIVEDMISTRAIQSSYKQRSGNDREVASIAHYAFGGEAAACEVFAQFGKNLGLALRYLVADFAPDVVVLGGGISRSASLFMAEATKELKGLDVELRVSQLGDSAPLVGAGVAWFAALRDSDGVSAVKGAAASA